MPLTEFVAILTELVTDAKLEWFFEEFDGKYHLTILKPSETHLFADRLEFHYSRKALDALVPTYFRSQVTQAVTKLKGA